MKPLRFLSLVSLGFIALTLLAFKDFKGPKIAVVSIDKLIREKAETIAQQTIKTESLNKAIYQLTEKLNQDLADFATSKKVILFTSNTLKGGAEDLTEEFKVYVASQKGKK